MDQRPCGAQARDTYVGPGPPVGTRREAAWRPPGAAERGAEGARRRAVRLGRLHAEEDAGRAHRAVRARSRRTSFGSSG
ncbi:hypothetical protein, partial [[Kitasatospora] papulosa]|uniref:hypothetical protein n=1 Tax=[Kitasatospora] papulosa TaxID=1464011 RepID=UPI00369D7E7E